MPLTSDVTIAAAKCAPAAISDQALKLNQGLVAMGISGPKWWEVGAEKYREMRAAGETSLPKPVVLPQGIDVSIPSRDPSRSIPCRIFYPQSSAKENKCKGIYMHIHGGGWVLMSERTSDPLLQTYADTSECLTISVGYRLAPEFPFPAGPEDCYDVADHLVKNEKEYGGPLRFIGGESAGAHLSTLTLFHLLSTSPDFHLSGGIILHFGLYDMTKLPRVFHYPDAPVLSLDTTTHFINAFLPNTSPAELKDPKFSPFYEDLEKYRIDGTATRLPSALFTCGTTDPLLEDSIMMGTRWLMAGGEGIVKIYEGAPHGFIAFAPSLLAESGKAMLDTKTFIQDRMNSI